jgi:hypothetical protein
MWANRMGEDVLGPQKGRAASFPCSLLTVHVGQQNPVVSTSCAYARPFGDVRKAV